MLFFQTETNLRAGVDELIWEVPKRALSLNYRCQSDQQHLALFLTAGEHMHSRQ